MYVAFHPYHKYTLTCVSLNACLQEKPVPPEEGLYVPTMVSTYLQPPATCIKLACVMLVVFKGRQLTLSRLTSNHSTNGM